MPFISDNNIRLHMYMVCVKTENAKPSTKIQNYKYFLYIWSEDETMKECSVLDEGEEKRTNIFGKNTYQVGPEGLKIQSTCWVGSELGLNLGSQMWKASKVSLSLTSVVIWIPFCGYMDLLWQRQ